MKRINEAVAESIYQKLVENNLIAESDKSNFILAIAGQLGEFSGRYQLLNQYGSRSDFFLSDCKVEIKSHNEKVDLVLLNEELTQLLREENK